MNQKPKVQVKGVDFHSYSRDMKIHICSHGYILKIQLIEKPNIVRVK